MTADLPLLLAQAGISPNAPVKGITSYDFGVIAVYMAFMLSIGLAFRRLSKNTSDYFRCGGAMPWWITGTSAWVATFSAWAFVGAASEVYRSGLTVLLLFYASIPALIGVLLFTGVRFRRLRVVTWMEAVRERFGPGSEQFYTWIKVPIELVKAGIYLMTISVFMAAVLQVHINAVIAVLGVTITVVAFTGGAFAVLASDFIQMFLVVTITLVALFLTVRHPDIGGFSGLIHKVSLAHPAHFRWWLAWRPSILLGWGLAFTWVKFAELNSMEFSTMYLMAKSEKHARWMVVIPLLGGLIGPLIWVLPPLAATIWFPDLGRIFPDLSVPTEGAFVAVALKIMPIGLLGLFMCAMFGATLTSMDAGVNKSVGVFVRSFYRPVLRPDAPEKHLLAVGKACTLAFGVIIICLSLLINTYRQTDVFTLLNQVMVSLGIPLTIPIFLGLFYKKTPPWSAWGTALASFCYSAWANFGFARQLDHPDFLPRLPAFIQSLIGRAATPLTGEEKSDLLLVVTVLGTSAIGVICFFGSALFYRASAPAHQERVERLFTQLRVPVDAPEDVHATDEPVYRLLGLLCMVYGGFILCLMFIPNNVVGRLCFLFVGGIVAVVGAVLYLVANEKRRNALLAQMPAPAARAVSS
jgi:Na+/proline symporter